MVLLFPYKAVDDDDDGDDDDDDDDVFVTLLSGDVAFRDSCPTVRVETGGSVEVGVVVGDGVVGGLYRVPSLKCAGGGGMMGWGWVSIK